MSLTIQEQVILVAALIRVEEVWANTFKFIHRYKEIFFTRYGLREGDPEPATLRCTGDQFGITRERVRQICALMMHALRSQEEALPELRPVLDKLDMRVKGLKKGRPARARI